MSHDSQGGLWRWAVLSWHPSSRPWESGFISQPYFHMCKWREKEVCLEGMCTCLPGQAPGGQRGLHHGKDLTVVAMVYLSFKQDSFILQRRLQARLISYWPSCRKENYLPGKCLSSFSFALGWEQVAFRYPIWMLVHKLKYLINGHDTSLLWNTIQPQKGITTVMCYNMDKPRKHTKWRKVDAKDDVLWFHLYEMSRKRKFIETESRLAVARW